LANRVFDLASDEMSDAANREARRYQLHDSVLVYGTLHLNAVSNECCNASSLSETKILQGALEWKLRSLVCRGLIQVGLDLEE
jgi:hypothetical protein